MDGLRALDNMPISFPGLFGDWSWNPDRIAIHIGHGVYWYGIILAVAMLCGMYLAMRQAKRFGLTEDTISDLVLWAVPLCILGSRTYYVVFNLSQYRTASGALDWNRIIAIWDGGIAMYGTVIVGMLTALVFTAVKRIPFGALADDCVMGLLLGQAIGRWANLINREAFGRVTDLPWRMRLYVTATETADVHPTFLYESLWNLLGVLLLVFVVTRLRRFDGENTCFYFLWYGVGRFWIEGLRTDSLYLFGWTLFGTPIRVSQALSLAAALIAAAVLYRELRVKKRTSEGLYVNRQAASVPEDAAPEEPAAVEPEPDAVPEEPAAVEPEPDAVPEEPVTVEPEPETTPEEPATVEPEPDAVPEEPAAVEPEPETVEAEPEPVTPPKEPPVAGQRRKRKKRRRHKKKPET